MGKKKHEEHENHERWLVSYADFMTLLFAFFVVLWSSGKSDSKKMEAVIDGMQAAFLGGPLPALGDVGKGQAPDTPIPPPLTIASASNPTLESVRTRLTGSLSDNVVQVGLVDNTLTVVVREQVLFASGSADINPAAYGTLTALADAVRDEPVVLQVIGHADGTPISGPPFEDNWGLASTRAVNTVRALQRREVPMAQLSTAAEITGNTNPERRAVTFRVVASDNAPTAGVLDKLHATD
jgi:chemotaxis protein MotB